MFENLQNPSFFGNDKWSLLLDKLCRIVEDDTTFYKSITNLENSEISSYVGKKQVPSPQKSSTPEYIHPSKILALSTY